MSDDEWTGFEMQTFLALIAKGIHIHGGEVKIYYEERKKKKTIKCDARQAFARAFNKIVSNNEFQPEYDEQIILDKLDEILIQRKHVVGRKGLLERNPMSRITRSMTANFRRTRGMDFDGSLAEWEGGRKKEVINNSRIKKGLAPLPDSAFERPRNEKIHFKRPERFRSDVDRDPGSGHTAKAPHQYPDNKATQAHNQQQKHRVRASKPVVWGADSDDEDENSTVNA